VTVNPRWMTNDALGWIRPRWAERKVAQAFALIYEIHVGWARSESVSGQGIVGVLGRTISAFGLLSFKAFRLVFYFLFL
jgi:hypothetical protein